MSCKPLETKEKFSLLNNFKLLRFVGYYYRPTSAK